MPRRKHRATTGASRQNREYKVRLPDDIAQRIEAKAQAEGRPQNRVIINELASIPVLETQRKIADLVSDMGIAWGRISSRLIGVDLRDDLLSTLREMLKADDADNIGELRARLGKVRVILAELEKLEKK